MKKILDERSRSTKKIIYLLEAKWNEKNIAYKAIIKNEKQQHLIIETCNYFLDRGFDVTMDQSRKVKNI